MEIPSRIDYNILVMVAGVAIVLLPLYPAFSSFIVYPFSVLLWAVGGILIVMGLVETRYNYRMDKRIKELYTAKKINTYVTYFDNKKINGEAILSDENKKDLLKYIKDLIKGVEPI